MSSPSPHYETEFIVFVTLCSFWTVVAVIQVCAGRFALYSARAKSIMRISNLLACVLATVASLGSGSNIKNVIPSEVSYIALENLYAILYFTGCFIIYSNARAIYLFARKEPPTLMVISFGVLAIADTIALNFFAVWSVATKSILSNALVTVWIIFSQVVITILMHVTVDTVVKAFSDAELALGQCRKKNESGKTSNITQEINRLSRVRWMLVAALSLIIGTQCISLARVEWSGVETPPDLTYYTFRSDALVKRVVVLVINSYWSWASLSNLNKFDGQGVRGFFSTLWNGRRTPKASLNSSRTSRVSIRPSRKFTGARVSSVESVKGEPSSFSPQSLTSVKVVAERMTLDDSENNKEKE